MTKRRTFSKDFKKQIVQLYVAGEKISMNSKKKLARISDDLLIVLETLHSLDNNSMRVSPYTSINCPIKRKRIS